MDYKVSLENFEGPLDLLLHLIKKEEVDIYDIPIANILVQYMDYVHLMELLDINVAGEFLVMASTLMLIKSKMLLPPDPNEEEQEDPLDNLVQQLLEYKKFKEASHYLHKCEENQKNIFYRGHKDEMILGDKEVVYKVGLFDLMHAFHDVLERQNEVVMQEIIQEEVTVEECLADLIEMFKVKEECLFSDLFQEIRSRIHLVCMFLAVLELTRQKEIEAFQKETFGSIFVKKSTFQSNVVTEKVPEAVMVE